MRPTITARFKFLIKNVLILALLLGNSCHKEAPIQKPTKKKVFDLSQLSRKAKIALPSGRLLDITLAITNAEQTQGLSGIQDKDYSPDQGMLFLYKESGPRRFWMPDTYFDLNIIFLDRDLKVVDIESNVPHHPGRSEPPAITRTRSVWAMHVLEVKADSAAAKEIKPGQSLKWLSSPSLQQIVSGIRQVQ